MSGWPVWTSDVVSWGSIKGKWNRIYVMIGLTFCLKVLQNLYNRVGQVFYGFNKPMIEKTRRSGKPRTPHNSDLCQACKDGLCADRK